MSLLDKLPEEVKRSEYVKDIEDMLEGIVAYAGNAYEDKMKELFVTTATADGLKRYEADYGIVSPEGAAISDRRSVIIAKMRGQGICSKDMLKNMAMSYSGGETEITQGTEDYTISIKFVGTMGVPPNIGDFEASIREIIPAHIAYTLVYTYATWDMASDFKWNELSAHTWEQVRNGGML